MEDYINSIEFQNKLIQMYEQVNEDITATIIKQIESGGDISSFTQAKYETLVKTGGKEIFDTALKELDNISNSRKQELINIFNDVTVRSLDDYDDVFSYLEKEIGLQGEQKKVLANNINSANESFENLTQTIAFSAQQNYVDTMDSNYLAMSTGGITFQEAFTNAVGQLANSGVVLNTGKQNISLEAQVRRGLKYSLTNSIRTTNKALDDEFGTDGVQINISPNCRPSHIPINGQMMSNEEFEKKKHLLDDYGCQHYATGVFMEFSQNRYTDKEIEEANNRTVTYKGEEIPYYEATQKQRALERAIRNAKKEENILKKAGQPITDSKVSKYQAQMRELIDETGLYRDYDREQVISAKTTTVKTTNKNTTKTTSSVKTLEENSDIWYNSLSDKDKEYLNSYTSGNDMEVNRYNRIKNNDYNAYDDNNNVITDVESNYGKQGVAYYEDMTKNLDKAIDKYDLQQNITVYRTVNDDGLRSVGINNVYEELYEVNGMDKIKNAIGNNMQDSGYLSTSTNINEPFRLNSEAPILYEIEVPKGSNGAYVGTHSEINSQEEFILARNTELKINEIKEETIKYINDNGEEIEKFVIKIKAEVVNK